MSGIEAQAQSTIFFFGLILKAMLKEVDGFVIRLHFELKLLLGGPVVKN